MMNQSKKIIFFGSGPVAAKSLEFLAKKFSIEAVITKPYKRNSKGSVPVIEVSKNLNLNLFYASSKTELDDIFNTGSFSSQIGVLIDFGIIVSQKVIDFFMYGIVNSHFSLLPKWRGPDPISYSILSGESETGVSLMILSEGIDEGRLIAQEKILLDLQNATQLTEQLISLSNSMIEKYLPLYVSQQLEPYDQSSLVPASYSKKLSKKNGLIDWSKPAVQLEREVRAFIEWPKSYTEINSVQVIIKRAKIDDTSGPIGKIIFDKDTLLVCCTDKSLNILELRPVGRNDMNASSFISGYQKNFKY